MKKASLETTAEDVQLLQKILRCSTSGAREMELSDKWEGNSGKSCISPEKLHQAAEALKAASPQTENHAA